MTDVENMAVTVLQALFDIYKILHCKHRQDLGSYSPTIFKNIPCLFHQDLCV